jgi:hypothetical protein
MKKISQAQIDTIIAEFYKLNAPVQNFEALRKMLLELPEIGEKKEK